MQRRNNKLLPYNREIDNRYMDVIYGWVTSFKNTTATKTLILYLILFTMMMILNSPFITC